MRYTQVPLENEIWKSELVSSNIFDLITIKELNEDTSPCNFQSYLSNHLSGNPINYSGSFTISVTGGNSIVRFSTETTPITLAELDAQWNIYNNLSLSTIESIYLNRNDTTLYKDFRRARKLIQNEYNTIGFSSLTEMEQKICARLFVANKAERDTVYSPPEQQEHSVDFHTNSGEARQSRYNTVFIFLYNNLPITESLQLVADPNIAPLLDAYLFKGLEGTLEDYGRLGIFDFILSRVGTIFENNGLLEYPLNPLNGLTMAHIQGTCKSIIIDGVY